MVKGIQVAVLPCKNLQTSSQEIDNMRALPSRQTPSLRSLNLRPPNPKNILITHHHYFIDVKLQHGEVTSMLLPGSASRAHMSAV